MTCEEEYMALIERYRRFLITAELQIDKGFYDLAVFSLEQALQLRLKAALLALGAAYPRTHSVRRLLELVHQITGNKEVKNLLTKYSVELGALEDAYISSRYVPRSYTKEEAERLKEVVKEVSEIVGKATSSRS